MDSFYSFLFSEKYENMLITGLRISIAVIFIWFGLLKVAGFDPVLDLVKNSILPASMATGGGLLALGILEVIIGVLVLTNRFLLFTYSILLLHLVGTFSPFILGWGVVFKPYFPVLSLEGEFVFKNIILIISALVVFIHEKRKQLGVLRAM